jgi:integrase
MASTIDPGTIASYALYLETHWEPHFPSLLDVNTTAVKGRIAERLLVVKAETVRKELSALRGLMAWAVESGLISDAPVIPGVPKRVQGNSFAKRRRSKPGELTQAEIRKFIAALPLSTPKLGPVRARFILGYEMALRPSLLDRLSTPEHWRPGSDWLDLPAWAMKGRRDSRKRLTRTACLALESLELEPGLIFGDHDYRDVVAKAAAVALPPEKAATFTAAHLRSAGITHFLERGASLPNAQALADHKHASTTDRYVRASEKGIEKELKRQRRI